jgi:predicted O-methyltransferase YrrM
MTWEDVEGWFDYQTLYDFVAGVVPDGGRLVEVGCWYGRSVIYLASKLREQDKLNTLVYAVDNWAGSACDALDEYFAQQAAAGTPVYDKFRSNVEACGVAGLVQPVVADSAAAASLPLFRDQSLDFVFIDADHRYDAVVADVRAWKSKVKPGGILAGHDYNRDDVYRAVRDVLGDAAKTWGGLPHKPDNGNLTCWWLQL